MCVCLGHNALKPTAVLIASHFPRGLTLKIVSELNVNTTTPKWDYLNVKGPLVFTSLTHTGVCRTTVLLMTLQTVYNAYFSSFPIQEMMWIPSKGRCPLLIFHLNGCGHARRCSVTHLKGSQPDSSGQTSRRLLYLAADVQSRCTLAICLLWH